MLINSKCKHQLLCLDRSYHRYDSSFFNRAPPGLPLSKTPLICLDARVSHLGKFISHLGSSASHLAGSYDEVGHAGFADPKCLHELLFRRENANSTSDNGMVIAPGILPAANSSS